MFMDEKLWHRIPEGDRWHRWSTACGGVRWRWIRRAPDGGRRREKWNSERWPMSRAPQLRSLWKFRFDCWMRRRRRLGFLPLDWEDPRRNHHHPRVLLLYRTFRYAAPSQLIQQTSWLRPRWISSVPLSSQSLSQTTLTRKPSSYS